ncbi:MAG: hypothetical protein IPH86_05945 [bacterium]|nr:hypothetical protein [bacterium]
MSSRRSVSAKWPPTTCGSASCSTSARTPRATTTCGTSTCSSTRSRAWTHASSRPITSPPWSRGRNSAISRSRSTSSSPGILANPESAKLHFQVGFTYYVFFQDYRRSATWFEAAARCPDGGETEARFAAFARYRAGDDRVSLELWKEMAASTESPQMRELAEKMVEKLERKLTIQKLYGPDFIGPIPEL